MDNLETTVESPQNPDCDAIEQETDQQIADCYCEVCKSNLKDTSNNPDSFLCSSCRERFIHYPFPKWLFLVIILIIFISVFAFFRVPTLVSDYKTYKSAQSSYQNLAYQTAANQYLSISNSYKNSMRIHERLFLALVKAQRFDEAADTLNNYLVGKDANDETYDEISDYVVLLEKYYLTADKIYTFMQDETNTDTSAVYQKIEPLLNDSQYDSALILYYLGQLNLTMEKDELGIQQLQQAYEKEPRYTFIISYVATAQRRNHEYAQAIETYSSALAKNAEDESAYRGLSIVHLLMGDQEKGLEEAKKAYTINPFGLYIAESYAVALYVNDQKEEAARVYSDIKSTEGYVVDQEYENFFAGKSSLEALYLN